VSETVPPSADRAERLLDVSGLRTVVTGAASGIGRAMAEVMAANGARVVLADIDAERLGAVAEQLRATGAEVSTAPVDVADEDSVQALFATAAERLGGVDVTFANAGLNRGMNLRDPAGAIDAFTRADWDHVLGVNLTGTFHTVAASARLMKPHGAGAIVVTASTASLRAEPLIGYAYAASKAAVASLVRQASIELAAHGIRINAIAPGPIATAIGAGRPKPPEWPARVRGSIPLGRSGTPQDLKGISLLLASPAASFVTGSVWTIDGGASALTQGAMEDVGPEPPPRS
jgi:NAD(P)-dependent dehydrogenase (short-subunit alcohol dehydrogenase family)